jgi:hypothetical protein
MLKQRLYGTLEELHKESLLYISDLANPWGYSGSLFLISARSVGKRGNTSTVAGHCILKY